MRQCLRALALAVLAGAVVAAGCGGGSDGGGDNERAAPTTAAPPTTTVPPFTSTIAQATAPNVQVFDGPGGTPTQSFQNPWNLNNDPAEPTVPLVFLVEEERDDGWVRVLMPVRPNGSTGWIRASDVTLTPTRYHITISLTARQITVYDGETTILQEPAAVGKPETPTPPGRYFIRVLIQSIDQSSVYGPFAYGLSGFSDTLTTFNGGDAELGIHGNNDASVLGSPVTSGCTRISNESITRLTSLLPLGTPVEIVA